MENGMPGHVVKAAGFMRKITYATIATSGHQAQPWNSPVYFAYDLAGNIYWSSHTASQHTINIDANGRAFIVIYDSTSPEGEGLYLDCTATRLENIEDIKIGLWLLGNRRKRPFIHIDKFMGDGQQRIYKATPKRLWINDADKDADGDFIRDYRIDIPLAEFQAALQ